MTERSVRIAYDKSERNPQFCKVTTMSGYAQFCQTAQKDLCSPGEEDSL
ncbi:MAG: hypothetical protein GQF41_1039 [Candidatus Rifleibacterium amylolyticum]|nr:MAG: hypothetical protein GQF41_1039 [Candidatus Rifleibacterium amylolyticum]